jgi:hypothetical protein
MNRSLSTTLARFGARLIVAPALALALGGVASLEALSAPRAELWERWAAHDPDAAATIDHAAWDRLLETYLVPGSDGVNRFAYGRVTDEDRRALDGYVAGLAGLPISRFGRPEQLAYWINLYNALTVKVVLAHYPVRSIRDIDISPGLFADGPWGKKLVRIDDEAVSLDDIEHRILRPIWRDPRLHYAVNCASISCPNLRATAFTAANTDALLEAGARDYVNHPRGARVEKGGLIVSSVYVWFEEDFGGGEAGVIAHLKRHAGPDLAAALNVVDRIGGHHYDWRLNEARGP